VRLRVEPKEDTDFGKVRSRPTNLKIRLDVQHRPIITAQAGFISIDVRGPTANSSPSRRCWGRAPRRPGWQARVPRRSGRDRPHHWLDLSDLRRATFSSPAPPERQGQLLKTLLLPSAHHSPPIRYSSSSSTPSASRSRFGRIPPFPARAGRLRRRRGPAILERCCEEMETRYATLAPTARTRRRTNRRGGRGRVGSPSRRFSDLMPTAARRRTGAYLTRLGAKARAAGIHLRPRHRSGPRPPLSRRCFAATCPGRISLQVPTERGLEDHP